jgi:CO/xanthine dehydrogenase FAD-binding subunit
VFKATRVQRQSCQGGGNDDDGNSGSGGGGSESGCQALPAGDSVAMTKEPWRERPVEDFLKGKTLTTNLINQSMAQALANTAPLKYNATKVDMAKGLLASGLEKLSNA